jgi:citrate lyase subunit beta/citryl-CoA lyase
MTHIIPTTMLFVPGDRPDRLTKAAVTGADAIVMDLEDAVIPENKAACHATLESLAAFDVPLFVRCNGTDSAWFADDLATIADSVAAGVIVPKTETPDQIDAVQAVLGKHAFIIALVETARGIANLADILAHSGVAVCAFGHLDFALDLGTSPDWEPLLYARHQLVLQSRLANKPKPLDGVSVEIDDIDAVSASAMRARAMGFGGKLLIHPNHVDPVMAAFVPDKQAYQWALAAVGQSEAGAAAKMDGQMLDLPVIKKAKQIIRDYENHNKMKS